MKVRKGIPVAKHGSLLLSIVECNEMLQELLPKQSFCISAVTSRTQATLVKSPSLGQRVVEFFRPYWALAKTSFCPWAQTKSVWPLSEHIVTDGQSENTKEIEVKSNTKDKKNYKENFQSSGLSHIWCQINQSLK